MKMVDDNLQNSNKFTQLWTGTFKNLNSTTDISLRTLNYERIQKRSIKLQPNQLTILIKHHKQKNEKI